MRYLVEVAGRTREIVIDGAAVTLAGRTVEARLTRLGRTPVHQLLLDGRSYEVIASPGLPGTAAGAGSGGDGRLRWRLLIGGHRFDVTVTDERAEAARAILGRGAPRAGGGVVAAPMPGLVVRVLVAEGQRVGAGTPLVVVEAMKMENELRAGAAGRVRRVLVVPGAAVERGQALVELEADR